jgi:hypothetical protein
MTEPLSPAARAVIDAAMQYEINPECYSREIAAAALRAAADQVVPLSYEDLWTDGRMLQYEKRDPVREKFLAIAAELEVSND